MTKHDIQFCTVTIIILVPNYKKILRLSYDYRKLLSHRKIIVRFSCNQASGVILRITSKSMDLQSALPILCILQ